MEDYSFYYVDGMLIYAGKTATIVQIARAWGHKGTTPDDGKMYTLDIDNGRYDWASSMLLPVNINTSTTDQIKEVLRVKVADDDNRYQINFNL